MIPVGTGVVSNYDKIILHAAGHYNDTYKPVIAPADNIMPPASFEMPSTAPSRTDEGIIRDDIDSSYMEHYNMRILKVFNEQAELTVKDVEFQNAGISDDVDFNQVLTEAVENSEAQVAFESSTLERILLDPSINTGTGAAQEAATH